MDLQSVGINFGLYPKQELALNSPAQEIFFGGAAGSSKLLSVATKIYTVNRGWIHMGIIHVGDQVLDEKGNICNVIEKSKYDSEEDTYRISFLNGTKIIAGAKHEWRVATKKQKENGEEGDILLTEDMKTINKKTATRYFIKVPEAFKFDKKELDEKPYDVGKRYAKTGEAIPPEYLTSDFDDRLELAQGIFENCGEVIFVGRVLLNSDNLKTLNDVRFLIQSLGIKVSFLQRKKTRKKSAKKYQISFRTVLPLVREGYKKDRLLDELESCDTYFGINGIKKIKKMRKVCIQVDSPSHMYLVSRGMIPTHNSFLLRAASIIWAVDAPGIQIYLLRRKFPDLEKNHLQGAGSYPELLATAVKNKIVRLDMNKHKIHFKNGPAGTFLGGSVITLGHCQYRKDMYNYQGPEIHVLLLDEATHFPWDVYTFLRHRVRLGSWTPPEKYKNFFPKIISASNPGNISHNQFKKAFIDFADKDNPYRIKRAPVDDGGMLRQFIPAFVYDNPALLKNDPDYIDRLKGLGTSELVRAMLEGDWDIVAGGMFDDVWDKSVHVLAPFEIPDTWYINRAFDWGSSKPFSVQWWAETDDSQVQLADGRYISFPRGTLIQIAEWYGNDPKSKNPDTGLKMSNVKIGEGIREKELNHPILARHAHRIMPGPGDNQIFTVMNEDSYAQQINEGYWGVPAMRDTDIFFPSDKTPGTRPKRWGLIRDRLSYGLALKTNDIMENPGLFIFANCPETIRIVPTAPRGEANPEDLEKGFEDHILDAMGYRILQKSNKIGKAQIVWG